MHLPRYRSALMSGNVGLSSRSVLRTVVRQLSTSPDSLIPSRTAALITRYATQAKTIKTIADIAKLNIAARCMSACICVSATLKFIAFSSLSGLGV